MAVKIKGFELTLDEELVKRVNRAFPGASVTDIAVRALKKAVGDAELQAFAAVKRAEVEAEARRLNEEMGLA